MSEHRPPNDAVINPVGRPKRSDASMLPALTPAQLHAVRALAREGIREITARKVLDLTPAQWKAARADLADGSLSPLALAWAEGVAEGQADVISFMKRRMVSENSESAAIWLATNVFKLTRGESPEDSAGPRVSIVLNAPMATVEAFNALDFNGRIEIGG